MCSVNRIRSDVDGRATTQGRKQDCCFFGWAGHGVAKDLSLLGGIPKFRRLKRKCLVTLVRKFTEQEAWCACRP